MAIAANASDTRTVTVWREGQTCCVDATAEDILRTALRTWDRHGRQAADGTLMVKRRRQALCEREDHGGEPVLRFWAGLLDVVVAKLQKAGVTIKGRGGFHHAKLPLPTWTKHVHDRLFLQTIAHHDRGLIRYNPNGVSPLHLFAQATRAWPDKNITAIASGRHQVVSLARQLRAVGVDAFGFTAQNQPWVHSRVAVCTFSGMAYNPTEVEKQNIIIVLDACEALGEHSRWCLEHAIDARLFGLLSVARRLSPYEDDLVRCMFGFDELMVPWHGYQMRPIEVAWAHGRGRQLNTESENDFALKRHGIWDHDSRNRQIARLARACAMGDQEAVGPLCKRPPSPQCWATPPATIIVVENLEHALKLLHKLPCWSIFAGGLVNMDGLSAEQQAAIRTPTSFLDPVAPFGIVTHTGLQRHQIPWDKIDVVIRADAGTGILELPVAAQVQPASEEALRQLLVVDLNDEHHTALQRRTVKRWNAYCDQGWLPAGVDAGCFRLSQFSRTRSASGRKGGRL